MNKIYHIKIEIDQRFMVFKVLKLYGPQFGIFNAVYWPDYENIKIK
jgi:hypothetical protein